MNVVTSYHNGMTHVVEFENQEAFNSVRWRFIVDGYHVEQIGVNRFLFRGFVHSPVSWFRYAGLWFYEVNVRDKHTYICEWCPSPYWGRGSYTARSLRVFGGAA